MVIKSKRIRWVENVARMWQKCITVLAGKREEKRLLKIPTIRRKNNIKMDLKETGWNGSPGFMRLMAGISNRLL
jgi:hypothetical protein